MSKQFIVLGRNRRDVIISSGFTGFEQANRHAKQAILDDTLSEAHVFETLGSYYSSNVNREIEGGVNEQPAAMAATVGKSVEDEAALNAEASASARPAISQDEIDKAVAASNKGDDKQLDKLVAGKEAQAAKPTEPKKS